MQGGFRQYNIKKNDLLFPELSFKINGVLFDVFREIGGGHPEKYYQKAVSKGLKQAGISFRRLHSSRIKAGKICFFTNN